MSEKSPITAKERLENIPKLRQAQEDEAYYSSLYGDAGVTDASDEAVKRLEEGAAYEAHLEKMASDNRDSLDRHLDAVDNGEVKSKDDARMRFMARLALEIEQMEKNGEGIRVVDNETGRTVLDDKKDRLAVLHDEYANGVTHERTQKNKKDADTTEPTSDDDEPASTPSPADIKDKEPTTSIDLKPGTPVIVKRNGSGDFETDWTVYDVPFEGSDGEMQVVVKKYDGSGVKPVNVNELLEWQNTPELEGARDFYEGVAEQVKKLEHYGVLDSHQANMVRSAAAAPSNKDYFDGDARKNAGDYITLTMNQMNKNAQANSSDGENSPNPADSKERLGEKEFRIGEFVPFMINPKEADKVFNNFIVAARSVNGEQAYIMDQFGKVSLVKTEILRHQIEEAKKANINLDHINNANDLSKLKTVKKFSFEQVNSNKKDLRKVEWDVVDVSDDGEFLTITRDGSKPEIMHRAIAELHMLLDHAQMANGERRSAELRKRADLSSADAQVANVRAAGGLANRQPASNESRDGSTESDGPDNLGYRAFNTLMSADRYVYDAVAERVKNSKLAKRLKASRKQSKQNARKNAGGSQETQRPSKGTTSRLGNLVVSVQEKDKKKRDAERAIRGMRRSNRR